MSKLNSKQKAEALTYTSNPIEARVKITVPWPNRFDAILVRTLGWDEFQEQILVFYKTFEEAKKLAPFRSEEWEVELEAADPMKRMELRAFAASSNLAIGIYYELLGKKYIFKIKTIPHHVRESAHFAVFKKDLAAALAELL